MNSREMRTLRRAAERRKLKTTKQQTAFASNQPENGTEHAALTDVSPAILDEFGVDFIREANEMRARVEARIARARTLPDHEVPGAGRSTGPRTSKGKSVASRNSFKHGLASGQILVPGEDPAEFATLLANLMDNHQPANATEEILVREMVDAHWLIARASRLQANCFSNGEIDTKALALFMRYRATYERAFYKALNTLLKLQKESARKLHGEVKVSEQQFVSQRAIASREPETGKQPPTDRQTSCYEVTEPSGASERDEKLKKENLKVA